MPDDTSAPEPVSPAIEATAHALRTHALALPEAWEDFPWGETAAKVGKKAFLFLMVSAMGVKFTLKLRDHHGDALAYPGVEPAGYGLGRHGWITGRWTDDAPIDLDRLRAWIDESYRLVAPKRLVRSMSTTSGQTAPDGPAET